MALLLAYSKSGDAEEISKKMEEFKPKINERDRSDSICGGLQLTFLNIASRSTGWGALHWAASRGHVCQFLAVSIHTVLF